MSIKKTNYTGVARTLKVEGQTWGGVEGTHEYNLRDNPAPTTMKEALYIAGDFQSLTKATIVTISKKVSEEVKTKCIKS